MKGWDDAFEILFEQVSFGAHPQCLDDVFVIFKGRQEDDSGISILFEDFFTGLQTRHRVHTDIHQDDVRLKLLIKSDGFPTGMARCLNGYPLRLDNPFQGRADELVIVDNHDGHVLTSFGMDTNTLKPDASSILTIPPRLSTLVLMLLSPMPF